MGEVDLADFVIPIKEGGDFRDFLDSISQHKPESQTPPNTSEKLTLDQKIHFLIKQLDNKNNPFFNTLFKIAKERIKAEIHIDWQTRMNTFKTNVQHAFFGQGNDGNEDDFLRTFASSVTNGWSSYEGNAVEVQGAKNAAARIAVNLCLIFGGITVTEKDFQPKNFDPTRPESKEKYSFMREAFRIASNDFLTSHASTAIRPEETSRKSQYEEKTQYGSVLKAALTGLGYAVRINFDTQEVTVTDTRQQNSYTL